MVRTIAEVMSRQMPTIWMFSKVLSRNPPSETPTRAAGTVATTTARITRQASLRFRPSEKASLSIPRMRLRRKMSTAVKVATWRVTSRAIPFRLKPMMVWAMTR
ncbi:hypothetical protein ES703_71052 [subsurface metagenome]